MGNQNLIQKPLFYEMMFIEFWGIHKHSNVISILLNLVDNECQPEKYG